jgi:MSHA biogenesis protein MshP
MMKNRIKAQGKRLKVKGSRFFPCTLHLAPCCSHLASPAVQRGFSLVSAIFLLVVIAALGTFAVTLSTTQQQSAALDVLGSRAYQAARAGIEWGAYQVVNGGIVCSVLPATSSNTVTLTGTTLQNFTVTVNCGSVATTEAGTTVTMYQLTSLAKQGTSPDYVERQMSVTIAK